MWMWELVFRGWSFWDRIRPKIGTLLFHLQIKCVKKLRYLKITRTLKYPWDDMMSLIKKNLKLALHKSMRSKPKNPLGFVGVIHLRSQQVI